MAIQVTISNELGDAELLYVRIARIQNVGSDTEPALVEVRGYSSEKEFLAGQRHRFMQTIEFFPDILEPLWPQAYAALKGTDPMKQAQDA